MLDKNEREWAKETVDYAFTCAKNHFNEEDVGEFLNDDRSRVEYLTAYAGMLFHLMETIYDNKCRAEENRKVSEGW